MAPFNELVRLATRASRSRLSARSAPYWVPIAEGCSLGYRKKKGGGIWLVRLRHARARPRLRSANLGPADDLLKADGGAVLNFRQALDLAQRWWREQTVRIKGVRRRSAYTVLDALRDYLQVCARRGDRSAYSQQRVVENFFAPTIGPFVVEELTREDVREWRQSMIELRTRSGYRRGLPVRFEKIPETTEELRRRQQSANRLLVVLKAALNYALAEGFVECSGAAWREIKIFPSIQYPRCKFLSDDEQHMVVAASEGEFKWLVTGALYTGARAGELSLLRVEHFLGERIHVPGELSKNKKGRNIVLERSGREFFSALVAGRSPEQLIFTNHRHRWSNRELWRRSLAVAIKTEIEGFSFNVLRHTAAANWVRAGIPLKYIAEQLGHSVFVCERHYAHIAVDHRTEVFSNMPPGSFSREAEVARIRAGRSVA